MCDSKFASSTRKLGAFLRSFANTCRAIVRSRMNSSLFSFAFIIFFFFFFQPPWMMISLCKTSMRVNRFIVIAQALDQFPPFWYRSKTLHVSGTHITRMHAAYYLLQHCLQICAQCLFGHSSHNYYVAWGVNPFS